MKKNRVINEDVRQLLVYVPAELKDRVAEAASREDRSLSSYVRQALRDALGRGGQDEVRDDM